MHEIISADPYFVDFWKGLGHSTRLVGSRNRLSYLHDETPSSGIAPVIGVFKAQNDVLALLHFGAHHVLHLLGTVL